MELMISFIATAQFVQWSVHSSASQSVVHKIEGKNIVPNIFNILEYPFIWNNGITVFLKQESMICT
jgi:hypothetical protein